MITYASFAYFGALAFTAALVLLVKSQVKIGSVWLANLKNCGANIETVDGVLVPNNQLFAPPELKNTADFAVLYASYIGLVLYRLHGIGRLPHDLFFNEVTRVREQLTFVGLLITFSVLCILPTFYAEN